MAADRDARTTAGWGSWTMRELRDDDERLITRVNRNQVDHFSRADSTCRALNLPDGVLLRYVPLPTLFFFLASENADGHVVTSVFASDSAYDRRKIKLGEVRTPMFDQAESEPNHIQHVQVLLRSWIDFLREDLQSAEEFKVFGWKNRSQP
jgi:hypothetical protein